MAMTIAVEQRAASHSGTDSTSGGTSAWHMIGGAVLGGLGVGSVAVIDSLLLDMAASPGRLSAAAEVRRAVASPAVAYFVIVGSLLGSLFGLACRSSVAS